MPTEQEINKAVNLTVHYTLKYMSVDEAIEHFKGERDNARTDGDLKSMDAFERCIARTKEMRSVSNV